MRLVVYKRPQGVPSGLADGWLLLCSSNLRRGLAPLSYPLLWQGYLFCIMHLVHLQTSILFCPSQVLGSSALQLEWEQSEQQRKPKRSARPKERSSVEPQETQHPACYSRCLAEQGVNPTTT